MSGTGRFIGANWGSSHLVAYLIDEGGSVIETRDGPGMSGLGPNAFEQVFLDTTQAWTLDGSVDLAMVCGMATARGAWRELPYVKAPASLSALAAGTERTDVGGMKAVFVPGVSCINRFGSPDVMRGEELEVIGTVGGAEEVIICAPGTHSKWIAVEQGVMTSFFTGLTGELHAILKSQSLLARDSDDRLHKDAFDEGVKTARRHRSTDLVHLLFSTRSRTLFGDLSPKEAGSYLSGLILSRDIDGAVAAFGGHLTSKVMIVGSESLTKLYKRAWPETGDPPQIVAGEVASATGFHRLAKHMELI